MSHVMTNVYGNGLASAAGCELELMLHAIIDQEYSRNHSSFHQ